MINDDLKKDTPRRPFLFRFAELIPHQELRPLRYDAQRQISQVLVGGEWIDGLDAPGDIAANSRITATRNETTDDA